MEMAGAAWITVHGRTVSEKTSVPIDRTMIKLIKENLTIPVISNGDIFSLDDAVQLWQETGVNGKRSVMLTFNLTLYSM
jgi:tRNA-dihydrouridine synthase 4